MATAKKYPVSLAERLKLGTEDLLLPGTLQDFFRLAAVCEYPVEYQDGNIIAMSIASDSHEQIVANILGVFFVIFQNDPAYLRYGSNRHIYLPQFECAYAPDASIVKGTPEVFEYAVGKTANQNPWLLVEVISESTRRKDFGNKLPRYKKISSLQYLLYIEQHEPLVTVFTRLDSASRWSSMDFNQLDQSFSCGNHTIQLADIYANIKFEGAQ